jgi:8-oxo-dGTP pyrophosphatase MutT (NUDIX family)
VVRYVVGFALDGRGRVAMVRKARPEWQAGLLNGVGGKTERTCGTHDGALPADHGWTPSCRWELTETAMEREFREETGLTVHRGDWERLLTIRHPDAEVAVFRAEVTDAALDAVDGRLGDEGERIEVHFVSNVIAETMQPSPEGLRDPLLWRALANVPWLLALACYRGDAYQPFEVRAGSAEVAGR